MLQIERRCNTYIGNGGKARERRGLRHGDKLVTVLPKKMQNPRTHAHTQHRQVNENYLHMDFFQVDNVTAKLSRAYHQIVFQTVYSP